MTKDEIDKHMREVLGALAQRDMSSLVRNPGDFESCVTNENIAAELVARGVDARHDVPTDRIIIDGVEVNPRDVAP